MRIIKLTIIFSFLIVNSLYAEDVYEDIGPVTPDTHPAIEEINTTPKPDVDLPYKPAEPDKPLVIKVNPPEEDENKEEKIIPYILSKMPEPIGAPDPEF